MAMRLETIMVEVAPEQIIERIETDRGIITRVRGNDKLVYTFDEGGDQICGAKTKKTGDPCRRLPTIDRNRCKYHGGETPRGIAAGAFKDGRYSEHLVSRLAVLYEEARTDKELLSLRDEIAVIEARLIDLFRRVDSGESGVLWSELLNHYKEMMQALKMKNNPLFTELLGSMGSVINKGKQDFRTWSEIHRVIEQRRKLVESERKRLMDMRQMMTAEQAMGMLAFVTSTIRKHVTDRHALSEISRDIDMFVTSGQHRLLGK